MSALNEILKITVKRHKTGSDELLNLIKDMCDDEDRAIVKSMRMKERLVVSRKLNSGLKKQVEKTNELTTNGIKLGFQIEHELILTRLLLETQGAGTGLGSLQKEYRGSVNAEFDDDSFYGARRESKDSYVKLLELLYV